MTTDALDQAEYFYRRMKETSKSPSEFRNNVNAFVGSGRSVTWALQNEFSQNAKFQSWYAQKQNEMKTDELMTFFNQARMISVHRHPLHPASPTYIRHLEIGAPPERLKNAGFAITREGEVVWITKNEEGKEEITHATEFDNARVEVKFNFLPSLYDDEQRARTISLNYLGKIRHASLS